MRIWAISDLHLSLGTPSKKMDIFGTNWQGHDEQIKANWERLVATDDIVLVAGDISWAMSLEEAALDLAWLAERPGTKIILRGNHDYWWSSISKVRKSLHPSIRAIQNDIVTFDTVTIGGSRLWDSPDFSFCPPTPTEIHSLSEDDAKIFAREVERLKMSLKLMQGAPGLKIVLTHYPPTDINLSDTAITKLLEEAHVDIVVFGHIHGLEQPKPFLGEKNGIRYYLTSADAVQFTPIAIV